MVGADVVTKRKEPRAARIERKELTVYDVSYALMAITMNSADMGNYAIDYVALAKQRFGGATVRATLRGFPSLTAVGLTKDDARIALLEAIASLAPLYQDIARVQASIRSYRNNPKGAARSAYEAALRVHWESGRFKSREKCCEDFALTAPRVPDVEMPQVETLVNWLLRPARTRLVR